MKDAHSTMHVSLILRRARTFPDDAHMGLRRLDLLVDEQFNLNPARVRLNYHNARSPAPEKRCDVCAGTRGSSILDDRQMRAPEQRTHISDLCRRSLCIWQLRIALAERRSDLGFSAGVSPFPNYGRWAMTDTAILIVCKEPRCLLPPCPRPDNGANSPSIQLYDRRA